MFLLQLYHGFVPKVIPTLLPMMRTATEIAGPSPIPPHQKAAYSDLKTAQVKTVSFLTFILRQHPDYIRPFQQPLATAIVRLLANCPDNVAVRKELLVGIRHIVATDMRLVFFRFANASLSHTS